MLLVKPSEIPTGSRNNQTNIAGRNNGNYNSFNNITIKCQPKSEYPLNYELVKQAMIAHMVSKTRY
jgi:hypothetical protein